MIKLSSLARKGLTAAVVSTVAALALALATARRIKRPHLGRPIRRHRAARIAMSVITASLRGRAMAVRLRLHHVRANLSCAQGAAQLLPDIGHI